MEKKLFDREHIFCVLGNKGNTILAIIITLCIIGFSIILGTYSKKNILDKEKGEVEYCIETIASNMGYKEPIYIEYDKHNNNTWYYYVYHTKIYHRGIEIGDHEDKVIVEYNKTDYDQGYCNRIIWKENGARYFFDYNKTLNVLSKKESKRNERKYEDIVYKIASGEKIK